jgi:oligopeptide/dipeptide ABC transporter ATP-binding protein
LIVGTSPTVVCSIRHLSVTIPTRVGELKAVDDLSLDVARGEAIGIVGESGSGKTMLALALLGLVPKPARCAGSVLLGGLDVLMATNDQLVSIRGRRVGLILQDPTPSLNPVRTIGSQLREAGMLTRQPRAEVERELRATLEEVGLDPNVIMAKYPHELSGGMNQRVVIAMALIQRPELLIADEPTTALDVTTQAQILALLQKLREAHGMAIVLISHDMGVIYQIAERVGVMYAGRLVEFGPTDLVVKAPRHPYTRALIKAIPALDDSHQTIGIPGQLLPIYSGNEGCPFMPRCELAVPVCEESFPSRTVVGKHHFAWCWRLDDVTQKPS